MIQAAGLSLRLYSLFNKYNVEYVHGVITLEYANRADTFIPDCMSIIIPELVAPSYYLAHTIPFLTHDHAPDVNAQNTTSVATVSSSLKAVFLFRCVCWIHENLLHHAVTTQSYAFTHNFIQQISDRACW